MSVIARDQFYDDGVLVPSRLFDKIEELHIECGIAQGNVTALRRQLEGAVDALNAMIAAEERLLSGDDGVDALDGLRLALKQARTVVGGR
jgi:hypothetical protein